MRSPRCGMLPRLRPRLIVPASVLLAASMLGPLHAAADPPPGTVRQLNIPFALAGISTQSAVAEEVMYAPLGTSGWPPIVIDKNLAGATAATALGDPWARGWVRAKSTDVKIAASTFLFKRLHLGSRSGRSDVPARIRIIGAAEGAGTSGSSSVFRVIVGAPGVFPQETFDPDGRIKSPDGQVRTVTLPFIASLFYLEVDAEAGSSGDPLTFSASIAVNKCFDGVCVPVTMRSSSGLSVDEDETIPLHAYVGEAWMMVQAAANAGWAAVDPVLEPDPSDPDAIITSDDSTSPPAPGPFDGVTPEQLVAEGFDPAPFIRVGLLSPSTPSDATPPSTVATPSPGPNANGWNKGTVTVALASTDNPGGSGVKEIHVTLAGALTDSQVVPGGSANVSITAEGTTTVTYFAVDNTGNQENSKALTVRIDKTPPAISGMPPADCTLWPPDHRLVQVAAVTAGDALSGLAGAPQVTAISNEPETGTGVGDTSPDIVINGGTVQVRSERAGIGPGRVYTIAARASDVAGNTAKVTGTCTVPRDKR
jgi:hypothetical protein